VSLLLPQKWHPPKKKNAKAATPVVSEAKAAMVNAVKAVAKVAMASAAKAATVAVVVTGVASVRVSAQASATSAQKAHRQKRGKLASRVNPAPRVKAAATIAKASVMLNGVVSAQSARRVNAAKP
jgi:hypothetical protein